MRLIQQQRLKGGEDEALNVPSMLYKLGLTEEEGTTLLSQLNEFSPPDA